MYPKLILLIALSACLTGASAQGCAIPSSIAGGATGLERWIQDKGRKFSAEILDLRRAGDGRTLALVGHNPYSGVSAIDIYLFVCSERTCSLLATRYHIRTALLQGGITKLTVSENGTTVEVKSNDGALQLSTPFPGM
jgi:hypothetical protein